MLNIKIKEEYCALYKLWYLINNMNIVHNINFLIYNKYNNINCFWSCKIYQLQKLCLPNTYRHNLCFLFIAPWTWMEPKWLSVMPKSSSFIYNLFDNILYTLISSHIQSWILFKSSILHIFLLINL